MVKCLRGVVVINPSLAPSATSAKSDLRSLYNDRSTSSGSRSRLEIRYNSELYRQNWTNSFFKVIKCHSTVRLRVCQWLYNQLLIQSIISDFVVIDLKLGWTKWYFFRDKFPAEKVPRMYQGQSIFSQLMEFLPRHSFRQFVNRYQGNYRMRSFSCYDQFLFMAVAQRTFRESLRDIECCLRALQEKLYHVGFRGQISRSTLADANENRD